MKTKKMGVKKMFIIIGILFVFIGAVLFIAGVISISYETDFKNNAETTEAVIVDIEYFRKKNGMKRKPVVEYTVDGVKYKQTLDEYNSGMRIGDNITIYYDPEDPENVSTGSLFASLLAICMGGLFVIIGGAFIASVIVSFIKKTKLITTGDAFTGVIIDVKMNMSVRINRRHPYKVECEVTDPYTTERYLYSSENIMEDISELIGSDVTVYVDKNNKGKYYVDVKELINRHNAESNVHDYR